MSKTRVFALVGIAIISVSFFTNPSKEEHEKVVKEKVVSLLKQEANPKDKELLDFGMKLLGNTLADQFMDEHVRVKNYYIFSLTKINWNNQSPTIGFGAFQKVWLSPKIDEKAKELIDLIKGK